MTRIALAALLFGCAAARPPGSPPDTEIAIQDPTGDPMIGQLRVLEVATGKRDGCQLGGSCSLMLPEGTYLVKFWKERSGGMRALHGGASGHRGGGCLLARINVKPGTPVACKANGPMDKCRRSKLHTMNCGAAAQMQERKPGEPYDIFTKELDEDDD